MPRKTTKTEKPPLLFLEPPVRGARIQNVPDVRAALNPKDYFTDTKETRNESVRNSWVIPQFDASVAAAPPLRRGRRKCHSVSIFDSCSQLSRKNSACKFPSLSFETRPKVQGHHPKHTRRKKVIESAASDGDNQPQGSGQIKNTVGCVQSLDTPKRPLASVRKRNAQRLCDEPDALNRCSDQCETPSIQVAERGRNAADSGSTPVLNESTDVSSFGPPPDVVTPKVIQEENYPSSTALHMLLFPPRTPPCTNPPDILVADTPERDYGVKVTWKRRRGLMLLLKERGHLSDSDVIIHY
ncbi:RAD9, HUS1, RAD1-interacting nuclear orphan protein 1 [Sphaeramia orbicularis]|uniref:Uncharacterized protein n=1 Tax=Sphaeramia orbicularis TaxID=375764 RepID=A0A672Y5M7_9TELE|nr:RAD9, HUS1, RAD1-interacting nuclear orphan protein 1 [Sphaeramia orbicularis]